MQPDNRAPRPEEARAAAPTMTPKRRAKKRPTCSMGCGYPVQYEGDPCGECICEEDGDGY